MRKRSEFVILQGNKSFFEGYVLLIEYIPQQTLKLGLTIPKSYGNAVKRVEIKRKIREVFRKNHDLKDLWINIKPKKSLEPSYLEIKKDFEDFVNAYNHLSASEGKPKKMHAHSS